MSDPAAAFAATLAELRSAVDEHRIPGAALGVLARGEERVAGVGVTSVDHPLPVDGDTIFQAGSITKTLTATACLRLAQRGELDLDERVRAYLPELRLADEQVAASLTVRDLLTHAGGFYGDWFDDQGWGDDALERFVATFGRLEQITPPRTVWSYNNAGFSIAGRVLEVVTGKPYEDVARELAFPGALFLPWEVMTRRYAAGHVTEDEVVRVAEPWAVPRNAGPAGTWLASVRDLLAYARVQLEDETLTALREPGLPTQPDEWMGLAWFVKDRRGTIFAEHGGTTNGQNAYLGLAPARGFALAILTNHQFGSAAIGRAAERAFESYLGVPAWEPGPYEPEPAALEEVTGRWEMPRGAVELRLEDGGLVLQVIPAGGFPKPDSPPRPAPPPAPAAFTRADELAVTDGVMRNARAQLVRDDAGRLVFLRFGRRVHRRAAPA